MVGLCIKGIQRRLARHTSREDGGVTVEFVLWVPIMIALLVLVVDVSLMFYQQSVAVRVVHDANRAYALGRVSSTSALESMIMERLVNASPNVQVTASVSDGIVTAQAAMPASDLDAVGWFSALSSVNVTVRSQHLVE